jgi:hypothetical protein
MPYTPNTYSDYAIERDIRYIENQREHDEDRMIDAICDFDDSNLDWDDQV